MEAIEQMKMEEAARKLAAKLLQDCPCTDLTNLTPVVEIARGDFRDRTCQG